MMSELILRPRKYEREGQEEMRATDVSHTEMEQAGTCRQLGPSQVTRGITRVSGHPKWGGIIWAKASNILGVQASLRYRSSSNFPF